MPDADLFQWDFTHGVPSVLEGCGFDFIVSTYAMHHLSDEAKIDFISDLLRLLNPEGVMLIEDVAFRTREELTACRKEYGDRWDSDEHYFVFSNCENSSKHTAL
jgi:putative AdoMet-dependent methyltransferase